MLRYVLVFDLTSHFPESAIVTQIPGFSGTLPSKHYAGYFFFFVFIELFSL